MPEVIGRLQIEMLSSDAEQRERYQIISFAFEVVKFVRIGADRSLCHK